MAKHTLNRVTHHASIQHVGIVPQAVHIRPAVKPAPQIHHSQPITHPTPADPTIPLQNKIRDLETSLSDTKKQLEAANLKNQKILGIHEHIIELIKDAENQI